VADMSDFNLSVTVRNAHILRRIREQYGSNAEMCRQTGISPSRVSAMLTMREKPFRKNGDLTSTAEELCSALGATPSELWPKDMAKVQAKKARYEIEMTQAEALAIAGSAENRIIQREMLEQWASGLSPRYLHVLALHTKGVPHDEIAEEMGVSRGRAWQMVQKSLHHMRLKAKRDGIHSYAEASQ